MHITVKILLLLSFLVASIFDIKKRIIPDITHVLILVAGIINIATDGMCFFNAVISFVTMTVFIILITLLFNPLGGGDCKMIIATAFVINLVKSLQALCIGLLLGSLWGVVYNLVYNVDKVKAKLFTNDYLIPLAPFLSIGYIYILF